jgi:hypothetical protein
MAYQKIGGMSCCRRTIVSSRANVHIFVLQTTDDSDTAIAGSNPEEEQLIFNNRNTTLGGSNDDRGLKNGYMPPHNLFPRPRDSNGSR